jgi:hypothetical protein
MGSENKETVEEFKKIIDDNIENYKFEDIVDIIVFKSKCSEERIKYVLYKFENRKNPNTIQDIEKKLFFEIGCRYDFMFSYFESTRYDNILNFLKSIFYSKTLNLNRTNFKNIIRNNMNKEEFSYSSIFLIDYGNELYKYFDGDEELTDLIMEYIKINVFTTKNKAGILFEQLFGNDIFDFKPSKKSLDYFCFFNMKKMIKKCIEQKYIPTDTSWNMFMDGCNAPKKIIEIKHKEALYFLHENTKNTQNKNNVINITAIVKLFIESGFELKEEHILQAIENNCIINELVNYLPITDKLKELCVKTLNYSYLENLQAELCYLLSTYSKKNLTKIKSLIKNKNIKIDIMCLEIACRTGKTEYVKLILNANKELRIDAKCIKLYVDNNKGKGQFKKSFLNFLLDNI